MADNDTTAFGGTSDTPCFALLDGRVTDPDTNETFTFRVPLTKLPAVLGRSHETEDPNFFGLGRRKALSRKQCVIYYQDHLGGSVEWDKVALAYKKEGSWNYKNTKMKTPQDELPQQGFFVIECLGRNSITVNRKKLEQGESMVLESGSPIRISQHRLYFLLPTDAPPRKELIQQEGENSSTSPTKPKKGIKRPSLPSVSSTASPSTSASKKQKGTGLAAYTESLETMTTQELLDEMTSAIAANTWDRKNQMVGTVLGKIILLLLMMIMMKKGRIVDIAHNQYLLLPFTQHYYYYSPQGRQGCGQGSRNYGIGQGQWSCPFACH